MKKNSERRKQCILAVVGGAKKFHPTADPLPGGAGPPKFKSAGDGHYLHPQTQFGEDQFTQFRVIVVTDTTCPPAHYRQDRLQYTLLQLASVQCKSIM